VKRKTCGRIVAQGGALSKDPLDTQRYCTYERAPGKQQCIWHWLLKQPADVQQRFAAIRLRHPRLSEAEREHVARVPKSEWPEGERWCAGCQSFVPLFYCTGSRCKACASTAAHSQRVEREYGISGEEYDALFRWQGGVCFICGRKPRTKRLAVDHDHRTGEVRGLLCANNENGCNRAVVANLEAAVDDGLSAARRAVLYLEDPPLARMRAGERNPASYAPLRVVAGVDAQPPPF
jgi:hypothetical protein